MANIGVIGWGFVGQATGNGFATNKENKIFWYDKFKESPHSLDEVIELSEVIFLCVPTPVFEDYSGMDMSIVKEVVDHIAPKVSGTEKIIVIKSTVLPGLTKSFSDKYPEVNFAMNPEFLTQENANSDFLKPSRTVIGCNSKEAGEKIKRLYQGILDKDQRYFICETTQAEISKYMSNLILASKVLLANEFYQLTQSINVDYDPIKEIVESDPRIGTHLGVPGPDGDLGFGGACFPKDIVGLLGFAKEKDIDMSALEAVWKKNLKIRKNRDWEHMPSSFTSKKN